MDYRALILHRLDVFELTKLRSVNRALRAMLAHVDFMRQSRRPTPL